MSESREDLRLDLNILSKLVKDILEEPDSIKLDAYLQAYKLLYRFFCLLGTVFGFVAKDVISKIGILEGYLKTEEEGLNYLTVKSMLEYESSHGLLRDRKRPSGARTLLRLHRALEFVFLFLERCLDLEDTSPTGPVCKDTYSDTLAKYHPWIIQKGAMLATHVLPDLNGLIQTTTIHSTEECRQLIPDIASAGKIVYDVTQKVYEEHECLDLP